MERANLDAGAGRMQADEMAFAQGDAELRQTNWRRARAGVNMIERAWPVNVRLGGVDAVDMVLGMAS